MESFQCPVLPLPPISVIAGYFPQFACALYDGVELRPNLRTLQATFASTAVNTFVETSFDEQLSSFALFAGATVLIDPTNNIPGNPLKTLSDAAQVIASGIALTITVRGRGDDYTPVPTPTPISMIPRVLNPTVGLWAWDMPDNVKARFVIFNPPPVAPFTVWCVLGFYQLASSGRAYMTGLTREDARARLRKVGILPPLPQAA